MAESRIDKDWVDAYFDYGIDIKNRKVFMFDDVSESSISAVIKGLYLMDAENNKDRIELFIGSFGGNEYEMFALYDVIRTLHAPIHTIAIGKCMSAAPLLVACGERGHRYATPNSWFMIHQASADWGHMDTDSLKKDVKHIEETSKRWNELMGKHSSKTPAFWKKMSEQKGDQYFDAYKAQEFGLIDHIWDQKEGE